MQTVISQAITSNGLPLHQTNALRAANKSNAARTPLGVAPLKSGRRAVVALARPHDHNAEVQVATRSLSGELVSACVALHRP